MWVAQPNEIKYIKANTCKSLNLTRKPLHFNYLKQFNIFNGIYNIFCILGYSGIYLFTPYEMKPAEMTKPAKMRSAWLASCEGWPRKHRLDPWLCIRAKVKDSGCCREL